MVVFDVFLLSFCQQIASFCYKASKRKYVYAHKRIDVGTRRAALLDIAFPFQLRGTPRPYIFFTDKRSASLLIMSGEALVVCFP